MRSYLCGAVSTLNMRVKLVIEYIILHLQGSSNHFTIHIIRSECMVNVNL